MQNALRLAVVNVVGDLLLFLGKICVAAACGCIAFAMSTLPFYTDPEKHPETYINRYVACDILHASLNVRPSRACGPCDGLWPNKPLILHFPFPPVR